MKAARNRPVSHFAEAEGYKTKDIALRIRDEQFISFLLFPPASELSMNVHNSKLAY